ncbi:MAG: isochorismatase [Cyanobacteria bacterium P01_G01_bin.39]
MDLTQQFLNIPDFFTPDLVNTIYRVPYQERAIAAQQWAQRYNIQPANADQKRIGLLLIDVQNTFCLPEFELFVAGESGMGAVEDNIRLCQLIYRNLGIITEIIPTLDSHTAIQIFHPIFWVNKNGEHPQPLTMIDLAEVETQIWQVNPKLDHVVDGDIEKLEQHALHYVQKLSNDGKYPLTIWPYHSMLGGIGHSLVAAVEEAIFFHSIARKSPTQFQLKGDNPLTENYSVLSPEVLDTVNNQTIAQKNTKLITQLLSFDALWIAGQAKSHCVAWTIENLLEEIVKIDPNLAQKVYLIEDCMSPVVIPGVIDFTEQANRTFQRFADAGMNLVKSSDSFCSL